MDCKATVPLGEFSRGGRTRGDVKACDHDLGCQAKYIPCGVVDEDTGQLSITFGNSAKTSDFIVDALEACWYALPAHEQHATAQLQLKMDNGPESSGVRTQFLHRLVQFADQIGKPIQLLYFPPYHSKYNPIERCWSALEKKWNGVLLSCWEVILACAGRMTWRKMHPRIERLPGTYATKIRVPAKEMKVYNARLERSSTLPKYDITITPKKPRGR